MYIYSVYWEFDTSIFIYLVLQCYVLNITDKTTECEFITTDFALMHK